jgi:hypothetical protein
MWIGAIRLVVHTKDAPDAGTDNLVTFGVLRDGIKLHGYKLDFPTEDDLERGAIRAYDYSGAAKLPRINDKTPELGDGVGQSPMPFPGFGFEFSSGLANHLTLQLEIHGPDMWIKDSVSLFIKQLRVGPTGFDTLDWKLDPDFSFVASWTKDIAFSTDSSEGTTKMNLKLTAVG